MKKVILLSVSILLISLAYSFAEVPCKINYQGRLIKDNVPVDGTKTMVFSIYAVVTGGSPIWTSGNVNVEVHNGLFRYVIGSDGGDLSSMDWTAGQELYLEVQVEADILTPREELSAYPYAINSHLLEGKAKEYFLDTSGDAQTKQGNLNIIGNVGIGTTSPGVKLHVLDGTVKFEDSDSSQALTLKSGYTDHYPYIQWMDGNNDRGAYLGWGTPGSYFEFRLENGNDLSIMGGGNVGIGTTSPQAKLHIGGTAGVDGIRFPDNTLMTTAAAIGTVANVVMVQTRAQATYSAPISGNGAVITPLNLVITPKKAGNRIILEWIVNGEMHHDTVYIVTRNGVRLADTTNAANNRWAGITAQPYGADTNSTPDNAVVKIIDMNSLDVATTYELRVRSSSGAAHTLYLNRTAASAGQDTYEASLSVGIATEIWW